VGLPHKLRRLLMQRRRPRNHAEQKALQHHQMHQLGLAALPPRCQLQRTARLRKSSFNGCKPRATTSWWLRHGALLTPSRLRLLRLLCALLQSGLLHR
jgi:hypothetical protein